MVSSYYGDSKIIFDVRCNMRLQASLKNAGAAVFRQLLTLSLNFISRTVFIYMLGYEYLGVNGLFADLLSMLSVAELGIGAAIAYAMYKPMADKDEKKLYALAMLYRRAYMWIGILMGVVGVGLTPFLQWFIKDAGGVEHLRIIYLLVLANSVVTYFFSYKVTLLTVAQEGYKESLVRSAVNTGQIILQIIYLIKTKDYIGYLVLQLLATIIIQLILSRMTVREFPFLRERWNVEIEREEKDALFKNIRALIFHKMGNFFVNGTDNLIISKMIGLLVNGIYANYLLITKSIRGFTYLIFNALTASVGNLNAMEDKENVIDRFDKIYFMGYWMTVFCSVSLLCLLNPFISLLWGRTFDMPVVIVIVLNFYLAEMRNPVMVFRDAMGLYWYDRFKPLYESLVNIVFSIVLGKYLGILGVLIGTALSAIGVVCWMEPWVLYRHGFKCSSRSFFVKYLRNGALAVLIGGVTWFACGVLRMDGWWGIVYRAILCVCIPNGILWILFHETKEYRYFWEIAVSGIKKVSTRLHKRR